MPRIGSSIRRVSAFFPALLLLFFPVGLARAENPKQIHPADYVTDLAGVIPSDSKERLDALCLELQQKTGAQLAIVTVNSLGDESVEQFANELFQSFGVGNKKENNGLLLLVAPNERKYWTEVGYGLEPIINDARAGDAGRLMVPFFRQGKYGAGIEAAARQLADYVAQDKGVTLAGAAPQRQPVRQPPSDNFLGGIAGVLVILFGIASFLFNFLRRIAKNSLGTGSNPYRRRNRYDGGWFGGGFGGGGWGGFGGSSGDSGGGFGGFDGGSSGGGGAGGSW